MLYNYIKIFHIISAALLLTSMAYSFRLWITTGYIQQLEAQTGSIIIPLAILQLITGFTLISLKYNELPHLWIASVVTAFIVMIASWLSFICINKMKRITLGLCAISILTMVFLMATRN
jgi:uncharacterized membrane protein